MAERRLDAQPWMGAPATLAVMSALEAAGGPDCARFVGGCVRNTVLGLPVDDIDIATVLTPDTVIAALDAAELKWAPTGVEYGTVTAIAEGRPFEITTLRRDVATDGRRAVVAFSRDWLEDARRRDFRLNALYLDAERRVHDPLGEGLADAEAGRIVFVGEAETRIREDYLRILRFFRFLAWYGRGEPDETALKACAALKDMLSACPAERTAKELLKLLAASDPREAVGLMRATGVMEAILPSTGEPGRFEALVGIETDALGENEPDLRLIALLPDDPAVVGQTAARLRLSNAQRDRMLAAAGREPPIGAGLTPREARQAVYRIGARALRDRVKLAWAVDGPDRAVQWRALIELADSWSPPVLPVTGQDVMASGLSKGPQVGLALKAVEDWWIDEDFPRDRALVLAALDRVVLAMG